MALHEEAGRVASHREQAERLLQRFRWLEGFNDDELRQISMCYSEDVLPQDDEYFDLSQPERGVLQARGGERVPAGHCYVGRRQLSPALWDKLTRRFHR